MADVIATVVDERVIVTIFGADLLAPLLVRAETAADEAEVDAAAAAASAVAAAANMARALAAGRYGLTLGADAPALWDLDYWQTTLYQDSAATTPVTASGQAVGCVRNLLGDTSWDLIQADNAKRPDFVLEDGVPRIDCAVSEGLYARTNQVVGFPCYLLTGQALKLNNVNSVFGFVNNLGDKYYLGATTSLSRAQVTIASPTLGRAQVVPITPFYTAPLGAVSVIDSLAIAGEVDIGINGGPQDATYSPKATTFIQADEMTSLSFGVNIASESLNIGVADAAKSTSWYGGLVLFSEPEDRAALVAMWQDKIYPEIRETDRVIVVIGDSTGDDVSSVDNEMNEELFHRWARDELPTEYPNASIFYRTWSRLGEDWTGWERMAVGAGTDRVFISNASVSGSQPSYFMGNRFPIAVGIHEHIDEVIWNHGHNMSVTTADPGGYLRVGEWADAMDRVRREYPLAAHLAIRTHPHGTAGNDSILPVVTALDTVAALYGDVELSDVYSHFETAGRPSAWYNADKVHPAVPTGVTEQLSVLAPDYAAWVRPTVISPALMGRGIDALLNGNFDEFDGAVPDDWTKSGVGTVTKSTVQVDTELGDNYSVRLSQTTGSTYLQQTVVATPYQGSNVIFAVRQFIDEESTSLSSGRLQAFTNGTGAVSSTSWILDTVAKPRGAWRWVYLALPVPADATLITFRIYAAASDAAEIYYGRARMAEGLRPKDQR